MRGIMTVLFAIWGLGGFILVGGSIVSLSGSVGIGTSGYITMGCMFWIGGMIFFGLAGLLSPPDYRALQLIDDDSREIDIRH
uniref:Transmembrane protein n=1 Tax=Rhodopseudomonas palustris (strain DX-1) TaxID=652103 RepID=E6VMM1_RHOPX